MKKLIKKRSYDKAFGPVSNTEHRSFCREIVSSVRGFTKENILHDLVVEVEGETFSCHKFILASCSLFFRDFFRSSMNSGKEDELLMLSSLSAQTFGLILQMICTGQSALAEDNVLEIWQAAHFLQIKFLVKDCERFVGDNVTLQTLEDTYRHAKLFDSAGVLQTVHFFMQKHFDAVCNSDAFLALTFEDLHMLIKSDKLKVASEDVVLRSLFRWASHRGGQAKKENDNGGVKEMGEPDMKRAKLCNANSESCENGQQLENRSSYLSRLLKVSRYSLASTACLTELHSNSLVQSDHEVKNILFEAAHYLLSENKHGYWPASACYRKKSGMVHVGVCVDKHYVRAWDLKNDSWHLLPRYPNGKESRNSTAVFDNELYVFLNAWKDNKTLYVLKDDYRYYWRYRVTLPCEDIVMVSKGNHIYTFDRPTGRVHCISPREMFARAVELKAPTLINLRHAFCFEDSILVFCSSDKAAAVEETEVHSFKVATKQWTRCANIPGPAKYMVSFRTNPRSYYLIQRNGSMWQVAPGGEERPSFTFVKKLWSFIDRPRGAFIYKSDLYVVGNASNYTGDDAEVEGVFKKIVYCKRPNCTSNFAHCVLPKAYISDKSHESNKATFRSYPRNSL